MKIREFTLLAAICLALVGCGPDGTSAKAPSGQVVATVDGHEITVRALQSELPGVSTSDPKSWQAEQRSALQGIISRTILADEARSRGIQNTPEFAVRKDRMIDALLAETLASSIASSVPPPSREEAQSFVAEHPDSFAQREILTVDQVRTEQPPAPALLEALRPVQTLEEAEALLVREHVDFHRVTTDLDPLDLSPEVSESIAKLPPASVFVIPTRGGVLISQVKSSRAQPVTGEPAIDYALKYLAAKRTHDAITRSLGEILKKRASSVQYNQHFAPASASTPVGPVAS